MDVPDEGTDDTIREELARRARFNEQYRAKVNRAVRGLGSHTQLPRSVEIELDQLAAEATHEEMRRRKFDKEHPAIYGTPAEEAAAYAELNPNNWLVTP